ncbi:uncharacterized protein LOC110834470 isoform X3 [Zootermopsis nevadensis]|uniref:uncharacterized protein LOC110834470 isoform X3 n=1 Tax=Zootermopsis nevadensis TaxID=136037 RepID=UPI000B8E2999|nr:uncharacterized protein LOC110834470 isoform X3 [Zootermopsis nevadensis]
MPSTSSSSVRAEILAYSRTQSAVRRCRSQELSTSSDIAPVHEVFQRTHSVSELCSLFEQASFVCDLYKKPVMEEKKPSRLVGSKVSQIANIFQSMVPAKETEVLISNSAPLRNKPSDSSPKLERRRTATGTEEALKEPSTPRDSPTQVTVVRTESHVARFNNARALFEKLGAEDGRGIVSNTVKPEKPVTVLTITTGPKLPVSQGLHGLRSQSSSDNSSSGTSPIRSPRTAIGSHHSSRSPSPRERNQGDSVSMGGGSLFGIVSSGTSEIDGRKSLTTNGHQTNGGLDVDEEVTVLSTNVLTNVPTSATERLLQTQNLRTAGKVTESNRSNGIIKIENEKAVTEETIGGVTSLTKRPEKPEKPERKFNSRELIEKQRNWTSHFSKSRSSRYNSDPNKTEVRVGLSAGATENKAAVLSSQQQAQKSKGDSSLPSTNPAARSASFSATRPVRSPTVSPPPPPVRVGQPSPISPTPRHEKKVGSPTEPPPSVSPVRDTISSSLNDDLLKQQPKTSPEVNSTSTSTSIGQGSDTNSASNLPVAVTSDAEKRAREEEAGEVCYDVAHVDKRGKKMVSSVQLHLQAAGLGPTKPVSVASSREESRGCLPSSEPEINHSTESNSSLSSGNITDIYPSAPITNSVLRELENQDSDNTSWLPAARYTEITNHECSEKVEESKLLQVVGQQDTLAWRYNEGTVAKLQSDEEGDNENGVSEIKKRTDTDLKVNSMPALHYEEPGQLSEKEQVNSEAELGPLVGTVRQGSCTPEIEMETSKTSADVIGGSGYIASHIVSSDGNSDLPIVLGPATDVDSIKMKVAAGSCASVTEQSIKFSVQESEPFLVSQSVVRPEEVSSPPSVSPTVTARAGSPEQREGVKEASSEASILDLQDVEYADADAEDGDDEAEHEEERIKAPEDFSQKVTLTPAQRGNDKNQEGYQQQEGPRSLASDVPETMTPDEAENLLSSSILEKKIRQEGLLSDEEAQEVTRLLSPTDEKDQEDPEWLTDVLSVTSDSLIQESTLDYRSRSEMSVTMEDSMTSSHVGSRSGSESGLLGSVSSLNDQDGIGDQEPRIEDFMPQPGKVVIVENGVHYFEDGHFWMEVPGLPESEEEDDVDFPIPVKKNTKVTFSTGPIKVYSTFSVNDYDRRNEDVDPVAASAEYELEKRVEKMEVFPVELTKGPEGLGLSIIGMGVGADAGLEKLGIFVKTITECGAAARDGRIQVNDQIIEVDGKSLVGVTQAYAASVLRNTCGLVKFLIGREKDPQNSEVAQLIKQSLQADREREEQRRQMEQQQQQPPPRSSSRGLHHASDGGITSPDGTRSEDSSLTLPLTGTSPTTSYSSEGPTSPPGANDSVFDHDASKSSALSNDVDALRLLLQESQFKVALADGDISRLKARLVEMEQSGLDSEEFLEKLRQSTMKLREMEHSLLAAKKDVASYQDMLEQSQGQYIALEKKYCKAKKLLREFQQREQDLLHREEFYLQLLQEKDTEYNALVKTLKDRVIQLEQELLETQRKAGFPVVLPYDSSSLRQLTPQLSRRQQAPPVKPLLQQLEAELSDTEISDISPDDGDKTATVERKMPVKEELDRAVPPHELLDVSASKAKAELATRGGLAGRQLPTSKKGSGGLSSSSSDYGLDESCDNSGDEEDQDRRHLYIEYVGHEESNAEPRTSALNAQNQQQQHHQPASRPTSLSPSSSLYNNVSAVSSSSSTSHVHSLVSQFSSSQQQQHYITSSQHLTTQQTVSKIQHQQHHMHFQPVTSPSSLHSPSSSAVLPHTTSTALYSHVTHMPTSQPLHHYHPRQQTTSSHPHGIAQSHHAVTGVMSQHQPSPDPWIGRNKGPTPTYPIGPPRGLAGPPASLAEQLKQVLAERERRISGGDQTSSRECSGDFTEINKGVSQSLAEEIRQAVNEANARVKKVSISSALSPSNTQTPWQPQSSLLQEMAPPSPSSISSSGSVSPGVPTADPSPSKPVAIDSDVWAPPHPQDLNSSYSAEKKSSHFWQSAPVTDWSKEQVCQWLLALGLEQHIPKFLEQQVGGSALLQLESRDFKQLGVNGDDKNRLKRKLKELKVQVEKEKRQQEKERKEKERLQKKAEKLAEKASKRK